MGGEPIDTSRPNSARVYDYLLGGKDNFAADRDLAEELMHPSRGHPGMRSLARVNRAFAIRAVTRLASMSGIRQFLDLGCGLPTRPAVHETARIPEPQAAVAYVDNDPVVISHVAALQAREPGVAAVTADLADPAAVLADPGLRGIIDLGKPAAVLLCAVLNSWPADQARDIAAGYAERLAPGSALVISVAHYRDAGLAGRIAALYSCAGPWHNHGAEQVTSWFAGLHLVRGRVADVRRWPMIEGDNGQPGLVLGGVGLKPGPDRETPWMHTEGLPLRSA